MEVKPVVHLVLSVSAFLFEFCPVHICPAHSLKSLPGGVHHTQSVSVVDYTTPMCLCRGGIRGRWRGGPCCPVSVLCQGVVTGILQQLWWDSCRPICTFMYGKPRFLDLVPFPSSPPTLSHLWCCCWVRKMSGFSSLALYTHFNCVCVWGEREREKEVTEKGRELREKEKWESEIVYFCRPGASVEHLDGDYVIATTPLTPSSTYLAFS